MLARVCHLWTTFSQLLYAPDVWTKLMWISCCSALLVTLIPFHLILMTSPFWILTSLSFSLCRASEGGTRGVHGAAAKSSHSEDQEEGRFDQDSVAGSCCCQGRGHHFPGLSLWSQRQLAASTSGWGTHTHNPSALKSTFISNMKSVIITCVTLYCISFWRMSELNILWL